VAEIRWHETLEGALKEGRETGRPVFIDFWYKG